MPETLADRVRYYIERGEIPPPSEQQVEQAARIMSSALTHPSPRLQFAG